jgi:hypothetical protein
MKNKKYKFKKLHFKNTYYQRLDINQKINVKADCVDLKLSLNAFKFICVCEYKV